AGVRAPTPLPRAPDDVREYYNRPAGAPPHRASAGPLVRSGHHGGSPVGDGSRPGVASAPALRRRAPPAPQGSRHLAPAPDLGGGHGVARRVPLRSVPRARPPDHALRTRLREGPRHVLLLPLSVRTQHGVPGR